MSVSREVLERLARLARLRLAPEEADRLSSELAEILEHVRTLESVQVDPRAADLQGPADFPPTEDPTGPPPDAPPEADSLRHPPFRFAPAWRGGFFVVPRLAPLDRGEGGGKGA